MIDRENDVLNPGRYGPMFFSGSCRVGFSTDLFAGDGDLRLDCRALFQLFVHDLV